MQNTNYIQEIINKSMIPEALDLEYINEFLSPQNDQSRYLVGRNEESLNVMKLLKFRGLIDDSNSAMKYWNGIEVFKMSEVPINAWVLNCATSIAPVSVIKRLEESGYGNILNLYQLWHIHGFEILPLPWFVKQQRDDIAINLNKWSILYEQLADQESKQTLIDTLRYRLTANPKYMKSYSVRLKEQYFENFLKINQEVFVDVGGFDGDTTELFCNLDKDYKKVFFFEPSLQNLNAAKIRLSDFRNISFLNAGVSDKNEIISFNPDAGSASAFIQHSDYKISVNRLDDCITQPVTFIKMDIEGMELQAIEGASLKIQNEHPKLAIACYHKASHFWEILIKILNLNKNYKVYLRHYTQGWSETIIYFI